MRKITLGNKFSRWLLLYNNSMEWRLGSESTRHGVESIRVKKENLLFPEARVMARRVNIGDKEKSKSRRRRKRRSGGGERKWFLHRSKLTNSSKFSTRTTSLRQYNDSCDLHNTFRYKSLLEREGEKLNEGIYYAVYLCFLIFSRDPPSLIVFNK